MNGSEIVLELNDVNQLLIGPDSLFYGKRNLNRDAEEVITEEAKMVSGSDQIQLKIHLRNSYPGGNDEVVAAIHQHFNYLQKKSERQLNLCKFGLHYHNNILRFWDNKRIQGN